MKGISFSIAIGSWGTPGLIFEKTYWRLCLGFIAFQLWFVDIEDTISNLFLKLKQERTLNKELETKYGLKRKVVSKK